MLRLTVAALLITALVPSLSARTKHFLFRLYAQGNEKDGEVFASAVTAPISGRKMFIEQIPIVSEKDVKAVRPYPAADGTWGAVFELDEHGRLALETTSAARRGGTLLVIADGRVVTELVIDRQVSDGILYVRSGLTAAEIELIKKDWPQADNRRRR